MDKKSEDNGRASVGALALIIAGSMVIVCVLLAAASIGQAYQSYVSAAAIRLVPIRLDRYAEENSRVGTKKSFRIVFFGDSRIVGWDPKPTFNGAEVLFRGISGETTTQMRYRFDSDVIRLAPDVVVIEAGINDLVAGALLGREPYARNVVIANLNEMINAASKVDIEVVLLTVIRPSKPSLVRRLLWRANLKQSVEKVNAAVRKQFGSRVTIFDADEILSRGPEYLTKPYSRNTLHFTQQAYVMLNAQLAALLEGPRAVQ